MWYKYTCYVNDISRNLLVRYFCGKSDTSDTSNTANSSDASKTSASVTRLSSYFRCFRVFHLIDHPEFDPYINHLEINKWLSFKISPVSFPLCFYPNSKCFGRSCSSSWTIMTVKFRSNGFACHYNAHTKIIF